MKSTKTPKAMAMILSLTLAASAASVYAANEEAPSEEAVGIANPWTEMTEDELLEASGMTFGVPEDAKDVVYRWLEDESLAEMQFMLGEDEYCARIMPDDLEEGQLDNISDMYFQS